MIVSPFLNYGSDTNRKKLHLLGVYAIFIAELYYKAKRTFVEVRGCKNNREW